MARTFSIQTSADPSSLLARARKTARANGVTLVGDERAGRFSHDMIKGHYRRGGETVLVTITEKPLIIPWSIVEAQVRAFVG